MKAAIRLLSCLVLISWSATSLADSYSDTVTLFKNAGESAGFFKNCYGYAVFPTIGKGGLVVGGAHGSGRVYAHDKYVGDTSMTQVTVGFQAGGQAYSQIIFFEDQRSFDEFTSGNFEFGADVSPRRRLRQRQAPARAPRAHLRAQAAGRRMQRLKASIAKAWPSSR